MEWNSIPTRAVIAELAQTSRNFPLRRTNRVRKNHDVGRDLLVDQHGRRTWTAEDPIEITQEGLRQVEVDRIVDLCRGHAGFPAGRS